jgi:hypothetical protein
VRITIVVEFFARLVLALGYPYYSHDANMLLLALFEIM